MAQSTGEDWSAYVCEICEQPFHECFCYKVCEICGLPNNECQCNQGSFIKDQKIAVNSSNNISNHTSNTNVHGQICVYFLQGRCTFGDSCKFVHAQGSFTSPPAVRHSAPYPSNGSGMMPTPSGEVCKFFAAGNCKFGSSCRFSHSLPISRTPNQVMKPNFTGLESKFNNLKTKSSENGTTEEILQRKIAQIMDLKDEISMLEDVLAEKRETEAVLEMEIANLQQAYLHS